VKGRPACPTYTAKAKAVSLAEIVAVPLFPINACVDGFGTPLSQFPDVVQSPVETFQLVTGCAWIFGFATTIRQINAVAAANRFNPTDSLNGTIGS